VARVILDQNIPRPLSGRLTGHQVETAHQRGWATLENGNLLAAAEQAGFDVMVTADLNIKYQQNLSARIIALVVLSTNAWPVIRDNLPPLLHAISLAKPGSYQELKLPRPPRRRKTKSL